MVMNLQYFWGRGSSSGIGNGSGTKQITINANGTKLTYRKESDGNVYSVVDGRVGDKIPRTMKQIEESAKKNGFEFEVLNNTQYKKAEAAQRRQKEETDRILDSAYVRDKHFVKGSRMSRIGNRATKRRRT